jgi:chromosome segregation ATPase
MPQVNVKTGRPIEYVGMTPPLSGGDGMYAKVAIAGSGTWSSTLEPSKRRALESLVRILAARFETEYRVTGRLREELNEVAKDRDKLQLEVAQLNVLLDGLGALPSEPDQLEHYKQLANKRSQTIANMVSKHQTEVSRLQAEIAALRSDLKPVGSPSAVEQHRDELAALLKDRNKKIEALQTEIDGLRAQRIALTFDDVDGQLEAAALVRDIEDKLAALSDIVSRGK